MILAYSLIMDGSSPCFEFQHPVSGKGILAVWMETANLRQKNKEPLSEVTVAASPEEGYVRVRVENLGREAGGGASAARANLPNGQ
jgi:hypothetical protein